VTGGPVIFGRGCAPAISAHRGGGEFAPEGSTGAYRAAVEAGAEYVEFDVRRTSDGVFVAYHRERCWSGQAVASLSYARLCKLAGFRVPLASEVMALLTGRALGHLDLKDAGSAMVIVGEAVRTMGTAGFVVTTGDEKLAAAIRRGFPGVQVGLTLGGDFASWRAYRLRRLRDRNASRLDGVRACGAGWAVVHHVLARRGVLGECRSLGIKVMVWTVNRDGALRKWLANPQVDVLVTDRPARAVALRRHIVVKR
jgi:glycerophosphoryl diester phosphodiesterase